VIFIGATKAKNQQRMATGSILAAADHLMNNRRTSGEEGVLCEFRPKAWKTVYWRKG
jgi:hypothetical protein